MARDLAPDVERLLESGNPYIRKKAALCTRRILKKVPDLIEQFADRAAELVHDKVRGRGRLRPGLLPAVGGTGCWLGRASRWLAGRGVASPCACRPGPPGLPPRRHRCTAGADASAPHHRPPPPQNHGVLLCGVTLMLDICESEPSVVDKYRAHVPLLCKILRTLLSGGFSPEHDVGGINDPFLQVKILRLLRLLGGWPHLLLLSPLLPAAEAALPCLPALVRRQWAALPWALARAAPSPSHPAQPWGPGPAASPSQPPPSSTGPHPPHHPARPPRPAPPPPPARQGPDGGQRPDERHPGPGGRQHRQQPQRGQRHPV
jgi:hypothetical protein